MKAIEEGLFTRTTKERLDALEAQKDELTAKIADEKLRKPSFNADFIRFWLKKSMFTGIGVGLVVGCIVFLLVMFEGDILAGFFTTDVAVIQKGYAYLKGFALETIVTAILFSMVGYFNGNNKTVWVMTQGLIQTLLVRLPFAYVMSIQPNASLTKIGLAAPVSTMVGIVLNVGFYIYLDRAEKKSNAL